MPAHGQPGNGARGQAGPSLFDRIPWRVVIPAGMQLAQELREAVRDYSRTREGAGAAAGPPPHGRPHAGPGPEPDLRPQLHELHRRLDRLESHHDELGRLIERLAAQATEQNRAMQGLSTRVAVLVALAGVALVLSLVAMVAALAT